MAINVSFDSVEVGQQLPEFTRKTDFDNWNRFAAVNDEFISIHMDDEMARAMGQPGAIGMGNLRWSYLLNALRDWAGDEAEILDMNVQFRGTNLKNDVLRTRAVVAEKKTENGRKLVVLDIDVLNQNDEPTTPGQATIALP
ncbi:MAG: MaoC/PaaZ C-terminal domain-containing protein [Mycobacterium sp.]|uniref:MaoC/PaaZ C-terminal domain-containing protein n=1 Tax=Mycobacterium sp. TaxID=1785 RepID=UPI003F9A27E5